MGGGKKKLKCKNFFLTQKLKKKKSRASVPSLRVMEHLHNFYITWSDGTQESYLAGTSFTSLKLYFKH